MNNRRPWSARPWQRLVAHVLATKGRTCTLAYPGICTGTATTADHTTPWSKGGTDHPDNLEPVCGPCNRHKSNRPAPDTDASRQTRAW